MLEVPGDDAHVQNNPLRDIWPRWLNQMYGWWRHLQRRLRPTPIVVMVANPSQRATVEFEVRSGLRCLERVLGRATFRSLTVVVQHSIHLDHPVAGCTHVGQRADGSPFALVRLALRVDGRDLSLDEVLSIMTEQCIGLAIQQAGGMSVVVPVEWAATAAPSSGPPPTARDPLAPSPNGHVPVPFHPRP